MLQLRDYQVKLKKDLYAAIKSGCRKPLIVAGTGSGKTECACSIVQDILSRDRRVSFIVHRDKLVRQTVARFEKYGLNPSVVMNGFETDKENPLQVVSLQSIARRPWAEELLSDVAIYDEAHITAWFKKSREWITHGTHAITIGLTATPWRLSKREEMGDLFSSLILAPVPGQLIEMGYLVKPRYFSLPGLSTKGVRTVAGDFSLDDLGVITNDPEVVRVAVDEWERLGENRKTIAFCVNVAHSQALAAEFNKRGIPAAAITGDMCPVKEREPLYQKMQDGELKVLVSCDALAEGFDIPDIGCAMLCRPTKSKAKYVQQVGRALRTFPGKTDAIILDQAGNVTRKGMGFIEDLSERDFSLSLSNQGEAGEPPTKECPECGAIMLISAKVCPECGHLFPQSELKEKADSKLVELRPTLEDETKLPFDVIQYRQWLREAYKTNKSLGYAKVKYKEVYDRWPGQGYTQGAIFGGKASQQDKVAFLRYLKSVASRKNWTEDRIRKAWFDEFGHSVEFELLKSAI